MLAMAGQERVPTDYGFVVLPADMAPDRLPT